MKLDNNVLDLLLNRNVIRFIAQPDKDGFSKSVIVGSGSHLYSLERVSSFEPCSSLTNNNVILDGVNKDYKTLMAYLKANKYELF